MNQNKDPMKTLVSLLVITLVQCVITRKSFVISTLLLYYHCFNKDMGI